MNRGDLTPEELKERQAKAMQDPEVQNILSDPVMRQVGIVSEILIFLSSQAEF